MLDVYVERATHFSAVRKLIHDDDEFSSALALLSVHAAISWNDAVMIKLSGSTAKTQDHMSSARATAKQCATQRINDDGIKHLMALLSAKSKISYGDQKTSKVLSQSLSRTSERFEAWANRILR